MKHHFCSILAWSNDSTIKNTNCSSRGTGFNSQHPLRWLTTIWYLQSQVMQYTLLVSPGNACICWTDIHSGKTHIHTKQIIICTYMKTGLSVNSHILYRRDGKTRKLSLTWVFIRKDRETSSCSPLLQ